MTNKIFLQQAMVGLLLGDGSLVKKYAGGGTYFKFAQSIIHRGYLMHVFQLFQEQGLVNMLTPSKGHSIIAGVTYTWFQFSTKSLVEWNSLYRLFYVDGVKVIPANIVDILTPVSLAYWFMDDGGWTKTGIHLATNNFTPQDTLRMMEVLRYKFGLKCSIHSRNRIYIWNASCPKFIELVKPYIHPDMSYKLSAKS